MVTSLIHHERIITTTPKAKELRRVADKMVTHAKIGNLHHRRLASGVVQERSAVVKLFEILGPRYQGRPGGYTRILKLARPRRGDSADMSVIEFVDREGASLKKFRLVTLDYFTILTTTIALLLLLTLSHTQANFDRHDRYLQYQQQVLRQAFTATSR
jgi:large subunit ribosomal protein L17